MCLVRNLQVRFPKIILVVFDIPVIGLTEGGDAMWGYIQAVSQRVVEVAMSKMQTKVCGYRYHTLLGKIISSIILLTQ